MTRECHACKHAGCDPDGPYCGHAEAFKKSMFGRGFNAMHNDGLCTTEARQLFEPKRCAHDWQHAREFAASGGCITLVCTKCGEHDEKDVS